MQNRTTFWLRLLLPVGLVMSLSPPLPAEAPKFGVVDVSKAFEAYYRTEAEKANLAEARAGLKKDKRVEQIKLTRVELLDLRNHVRDETLAEGQRQEYFHKFQMKAHELRSLQRDTVQYLEDQNKSIDEGMVKKTRKFLDEIRDVVRTLAKKGGYDYVFEKGGKTSSQIAPLIYIRHATDLTEEVIEILNKDAPAKKTVAATENP